MSNNIGMYIHFPFCLSKCDYCAFYSVLFENGLYQRVIEKTIADIKASRDILGPRDVVSIFFGGGTPSLMHPQDIANIIDAVASVYNINDHAEVTLESNPDTLNAQNLKSFKQAGINRLSIGCQSFLDNELRFLGRRCTAARTEKAVGLVSEQFENFNVDLIYGFPVQTENSLKYSLDKVLSFSPTHISCYKITFEPNTPLYNRLHSGQISDITEEQDIHLFDILLSTLAQNKFTRYEISNFAKPGFECMHNYIYWNYEDYIGIGAAAHSRVTIDGIKYAMEYPKDIQKWLSVTSFPLNALSNDETCEEAMIMGLRTANGIDEKYLKNIIKSPKFIELSNQHIIYRRNNRIIVNPEYMNLCDYILSILL